MASVNKVILVGNLGSDPETRYSANGKAVCNFRIATTERFNDRDGNQQERTEWHKIVVWGKQAEACNTYLRKGSQVYVDGKIQSREYEKDGSKRCITEIVAGEVVFMGSKSEGGRQDQPQQPVRGERVAKAQSDEDEEIPF